MVITGLSGSGKSTLAFDTISPKDSDVTSKAFRLTPASSWAKSINPTWTSLPASPPAIAIEQKVNTRNPRSTVGTSTEIYDYLKLLFARIGHTFSPISGLEVKAHSVSDVVDYILSLEAGTPHPGNGPPATGGRTGG